MASATAESLRPRTHVVKFYGRLRLIRSVLRASNFYLAAVTLQRLTPTCARRVKFHPTRWHKLGFLITKHFFNV